MATLQKIEQSRIAYSGYRYRFVGVYIGRSIDIGKYPFPQISG